MCEVNMPRCLHPFVFAPVVMPQRPRFEARHEVGENTCGLSNGVLCKHRVLIAQGPCFNSRNLHAHILSPNDTPELQPQSGSTFLRALYLTAFFVVVASPKLVSKRPGISIRSTSNELTFRHYTHNRLQPCCFVKFAEFV